MSEAFLSTYVGSPLIERAKASRATWKTTRVGVSGEPRSRAVGYWVFPLSAS